MPWLLSPDSVAMRHPLSRSLAHFAKGLTGCWPKRIESHSETDRARRVSACRLPPPSCSIALEDTACRWTRMGRIVNLIWQSRPTCPLASGETDVGLD